LCASVPSPHTITLTANDLFCFLKPQGVAKGNNDGHTVWRVVGGFRGVGEGRIL